MMGIEDVRNMQSFITEQIWINNAAGWLFKKKYILIVRKPGLYTKCQFRERGLNFELSSRRIIGHAACN
jgi:hypothetical protein